MLLTEVVSHKNFKFSRNQAEVYESLCSVIEELTGTVCKQDNTRLQSIAKQIVNKYVKRKKGKVQFVKLEERWLSSHEVRIKVNERKKVKVRMRRDNRYIKMKEKEKEWRKVGR